MNKEELIARWEGMSTVNLPDSPFGVTEEGHSDFRGFAFLRRSEIKAFKLENCDFSYANFTQRWIQGTTFSHCVFDNSVMAGVSDHCNRYIHCSFKKTSFRKAALGFKGTRFANCRFEECDFTDCLFSNAIFHFCEFINNKIKTIDFKVSGFWDCSFIGELNDAIFRGRYRYKSDKQSDPFPQEVGLHNVDFSKANLMWIGLRDDCPVEGLKMPSNGDAFLCEPQSLLEGISNILAGNLNPKEHLLAEKYLKLIASNAGDKGLSILSRAEMVEICEDEILGSKLYHLLKTKYEKVRAHAAIAFR